MQYRIIASVLICLAVASISTKGEELRCRCIKKHSGFIPPKRIQHLEIIPAGAHCETPEYLITLHGRMTVCADPKANWLHAFIDHTLKKMGQKKSHSS